MSFGNIPIFTLCTSESQKLNTLNLDERFVLEFSIIIALAVTYLDQFFEAMVAIFEARILIIFKI